MTTARPEAGKQKRAKKNNDKMKYNEPPIHKEYCILCLYFMFDTLIPPPTIFGLG